MLFIKEFGEHFLCGFYITTLILFWFLHNLFVYKTSLISSYIFFVLFIIQLRDIGFGIVKLKEILIFFLPFFNLRDNFFFFLWRGEIIFVLSLEIRFKIIVVELLDNQFPILRGWFTLWRYQFLSLRFLFVQR